MQRIVDAAERRKRRAEPFAAIPFLFEYRFSAFRDGMLLVGAIHGAKDL